MDCGHKDLAIGYGIDNQGNKICYHCAADLDRKQMKETGRIVLYLTENDLTNWPGSLRIKIPFKKTGRHNFARTRIDIWFRFDGFIWHGVNYGNDSQLTYCRRTKQVNF